MKYFLVYGTLSGSTMTAAELVGSTLKKQGHIVTIVSADQASKDMIKDQEVLLVASPSWEDRGLDGQPLPEIRQFLESLSPADLAGKKIALIGLGDSAYPHFCGAVDVMAEILTKLHSISIIEPLRIDKYYSMPDNEQKVEEWSMRLSKSLVA